VEDKQIQEILTKEAEAREALEKRVASLESSAQPSGDSSKSEAQLKEKDIVKAYQEEVARLGEQVASLQEKADNFDKLGKLTHTPEGIMELTNHLAQKLGYEGFWDLAYKQGEPEAETHEEEEKEPEPTIVAGKKEGEGWSYLPKLDLSIKD